MTQSVAKQLNPLAVIFGAGLAGKSASKHYASRYKIIGFVDNDKGKQGTLFEGLPVYSPSQLPDLTLDTVLIASEYAEQIQQQLQSLLPDIATETLPAFAIKPLHLGDSPQTSEMAVSILLLVCKQLDLAGVRYYVDAGTLLGIIRDNALIPWDDDLDIALHVRDINKARLCIQSILPQLQVITGQPWFVSAHKNTKPFGNVKVGDLRSFKLAPVKEECALPMMDLFIKYTGDGWMDYCLASRGIRMPSEHMECIERHEFAGQSLPIPSKVELYLERHYGDWRTPKKDWSLNELQNATLF